MIKYTISLKLFFVKKDDLEGPEMGQLFAFQNQQLWKRQH